MPVNNNKKTINKSTENITEIFTKFIYYIYINKWHLFNFNHKAVYRWTIQAYSKNSA